MEPRSPAATPRSWWAAEASARSGLMALCGPEGGAPLLPPAALADRLEELVHGIADASAGLGRRVRVRWPEAVAGRAALLGLRRRGRTSPNDLCRLLRASGGDVALNLCRPGDLDLLHALTGSPAAPSHPWETVSEMAEGMAPPEFAERARLLGLPVSVVGERHGSGEPPYRSVARGERLGRGPRDGWRVVDLSGMWAGPVTARILAEAGATVVKVEDPARPDGARATPSFYEWVHPAGEVLEAVDFASEDGLRQLEGLLDSAEVVIESSRPRALEHLGLSPEHRTGPPGQVWLSITGHGRTGPERDWVAFGDDAAVAGGLVCRDPSGDAMFCGDAIADPVTGLVGALAVLRSLAQGGGQLIDLSLSGAAAWACCSAETASGDDEPGPGEEAVAVEETGDDGWWVSNGTDRSVVADGPPSLSWIEGRAHP